MINKDTKIYGSFSTNPGDTGCKYFNSKFKHHKMNAIYKSFKVHSLAEAMSGARALGFAGWAIAMPFKVSVMKYLHEIADDAKEIGAVNTVINDNGILCGYNTDWEGFWKAYKSFANYSDELPIIAGTGGFSKAVQYAFKTEWL
jgi:shikimate dehydrogenase